MSSENSGKSSAIVLFDFEGVRGDNLSLTKGEVITILDQNPSGWWKGVNASGQSGIFPYNYVDIPTDIHVKYLIVEATKEYINTDRGFLSFSKGDKITVLKPIDTNWSIGRLYTYDGDKARMSREIVGKFPKDHVERTGEFDEIAAEEEEKRAEEPESEDDEVDVGKPSTAVEADEEEISAAKKKVIERKKTEELEAKAYKEEEDMRILKESEEKRLEEENKRSADEMEEKVKASEAGKEKLELELEKMQAEVQKMAMEATASKERAKQVEAELHAANIERERLAKIALVKKEEKKSPALKQPVMNAVETESKFIDSNPPPVKKVSKWAPKTERCLKCNKIAGFGPDTLRALGKSWHRQCFRCEKCSKVLRGAWLEHDNLPYCDLCHKKLFGAKGFGFGGVMAERYANDI